MEPNKINYKKLYSVTNSLSIDHFPWEFQYHFCLSKNHEVFAAKQINQNRIRPTDAYCPIIFDLIELKSCNTFDSILLSSFGQVPKKQLNKNSLLAKWGSFNITQINKVLLNGICKKGVVCGLFKHNKGSGWIFHSTPSLSDINEWLKVYQIDNIISAGFFKPYIE